MRTFALVNGDLSINNGSLATVTGPPKIQQDVGISCLTPYGSDRFHPRFGAVFNRYVGTPAGPLTKSFVSAEMQRIIKNYMAIQLSVMQAATNAGRPSPYSQGEIVRSMNPVIVQQAFDSYTVISSVNTLAGNKVDVSTQASAN